VIHDLKTWPEYFEKVVSGEKRFEVRKNDRNFNVGDLLLLREFEQGGWYTGRLIYQKVTYILADPSYVKDGYVVMSIVPMKT